MLYFCKKYGLIALRRIMYSVLGLFGWGWYAQAPYPVVLCYHSVNNDSWFYGITLAALEAQLSWMAKRARPVTLSQIADHVSGKQPLIGPSFAVTFDDGYRNVLSVKDVAAKLGIQPTIFVLSNPLGANHTELDNRYEFLDRDDILQLYEFGWEVGCHGATHADFWSLSHDDAHREVVESKHLLERQLGLPIRYFAYPRGRYTDRVLEVVESAGYELAFSMNDGTIQPGSNRFLLPRTGINRTHALIEFKSSFTPPAVLLRKFIKRYVKNII